MVGTIRLGTVPATLSEVPKKDGTEIKLWNAWNNKAGMFPVLIAQMDW